MDDLEIYSIDYTNYTLPIQRFGYKKSMIKGDHDTHNFIENILECVQHYKDLLEFERKQGYQLEEKECLKK